MQPGEGKILVILTIFIIIIFALILFGVSTCL